MPTHNKWRVISQRSNVYNLTPACGGESTFNSEIEAIEYAKKETLRVAEIVGRYARPEAVVAFAPRVWAPSGAVVPYEVIIERTIRVNSYPSA